MHQEVLVGNGAVADTTGVPELLETVKLPVADLVPYYRNAHRGNIRRIRASLREHGQFKPIVVNDGRLTGRRMEVLCGSHTLLAAVEEGWSELAAVVVDVDDERAAKINLVDNPRPNHPEDLDYDDRLLLELLSDLPDLDGAGYDLDDLTGLEQIVNDTPPTRGDAPEDDVIGAMYTVVVTCGGEVAQQAALQLCIDHGFDAQAVTR